MTTLTLIESNAPPFVECRPSRQPGALRLGATVAGVLVVCAALALAARLLAPMTSIASVAASGVAGVATMLLAGSIVEWFVHSKIMHRRTRLPLLHLAYDLHHKAHHWIHYPPGAYVQDEVTYVPLVPPRPERACQTPRETLFAALGQGLFYASCLFPIVGVAWAFTRNGAFAAACAIVGATLVALAVHVHDAVHCPGHSRLERFRWFWALDRHHYLHHIDTQANVNFLLPLGDWMLGTLRMATTPTESSRWPTYAEARMNVLPSCRRRDGAERPLHDFRGRSE